MQRIVLSILILLSVSGCGGSYMDLDAGTQPPPGMSLSVLELRESEHGLDVELILRNDSTVPLTYSGYSLSQPVFSHQYLTRVAWVSPVYLLCGTGLQEVSLRPGEQVKVMARAYAPNRLQRLRIGIASATDRYVVWSPIIDPATRRVGVDRAAARKSPGH